MTRDDWTPEEFARLAAQPDDAPERQTLAGDARFEARRLLCSEFEAGAGAAPDAADAASAAAELARRMTPAAPQPPLPIPVPPRVRVWPWAAAAAAVVIVVSGLWQFRSPAPPTGVTRGSATSPDVEWTSIRSTSRGVDLAWGPVAGADHYRIVFYDAAQNEIARWDALTDRHATLEPNHLPAGLVPGADVMIEVSALRGADVLSTSHPRGIRVP